jgi:hypothetical protein
MVGVEFDRRQQDFTRDKKAAGRSVGRKGIFAESRSATRLRGAGRAATTTSRDNHPIAL